MTTLRTIDASIAVAPQIAPDAIAELAAAGFTDIINNRPDGEDFGQPDGDEIAAAAGAAGMTYTAIPVTQAGFSHPQIDAMAAVLDKASRHAAPELLRMHESLARRQLAEVERLDLVRQVRELIAELLVDGGATLEQVAGRLNMPARRLRERLAMAGVRFNDLITDYRCRLAKELLLKTDERIEVIVERTGFSEPSTFYRAFKRWVGETPVEFRKRGKG